MAMASSDLDQHVRVHVALESWIRATLSEQEHQPQVVEFGNSSSPSSTHEAWALQWAEELTKEWERANVQSICPQQMPHPSAVEKEQPLLNMGAYNVESRGFRAGRLSIPRPTAAPSIAPLLNVVPLQDVLAKEVDVSGDDDDVDEADLQFQDLASFDKALESWRAQVKEVSSDYRTSLCVTFNPNLSSARALHDLVRSLGVHIVTQSKSDVVSTHLECPYATVAGDASQPALIVVFKRAPGEQKVTLQANLRQKTLCAKGRRGSLEAHMEKFIAFFGAAIKVSSSAPATSKKQNTSEKRAGKHLDVRSLILKNAKKL